MMKRILIVDDELAILTGLSKALRELCGFPGEIRTVVNGREAIYEVSHCFYEMCFLDIKLPDINGFDVMKDINYISPETNIILMSASLLQDEMRSVIEKEGAFFIDKPFNFSKIRHLIKAAMEGNGDFYEDMESGIQEGIKLNRKNKRRPMAKTISFYVKGDNDIKYKGGVIDISRTGVGIETYYPLERGHVVSFRGGLGNKTGMVVWSNNGYENHCRAGIEFV